MAASRRRSASVVIAAVLGELVEHRGVIAGVDHDGDIVVVLGRGADHRRAADIDVLDAGREIGAARDGFLERIEIDDQKIDRPDAVRAHRLGVRGIAADGEQAAMHRRMQRLDAAVHHFGKAGEVGDVEDRESGLAQRLARAAGRNEFDAVAGERAGEFDHPGLVGNGNEGARRAAQVFGHGAVSPRMPSYPPARSRLRDRNHADCL